MLTWSVARLCLSDAQTDGGVSHPRPGRCSSGLRDSLFRNPGGSRDDRESGIWVMCDTWWRLWHFPTSSVERSTPCGAIPHGKVLIIPPKSLKVTAVITSVTAGKIHVFWSDTEKYRQYFWLLKYKTGVNISDCMLGKKVRLVFFCFGLCSPLMCTKLCCLGMNNIIGNITKVPKIMTWLAMERVQTCLHS